MSSNDNDIKFVKQITDDVFFLILLIMLHDACHDFDNDKSNKEFKKFFMEHKLTTIKAGGSQRRIGEYKRDINLDEARNQRVAARVSQGEKKRDRLVRERRAQSVTMEPVTLEEYLDYLFNSYYNFDFSEDDINGLKNTDLNLLQLIFKIINNIETEDKTIILYNYNTLLKLFKLYTDSGFTDVKMFEEIIRVITQDYLILISELYFEELMYRIFLSHTTDFTDIKGIYDILYEEKTNALIDTIEKSFPSSEDYTKDLPSTEEVVTEMVDKGMEGGATSHRDRIEIFKRLFEYFKPMFDIIRGYSKYYSFEESKIINDETGEVYFENFNDVSVPSKTRENLRNTFKLFMNIQETKLDNKEKIFNFIKTELNKAQKAKKETERLERYLKSFVNDAAFKRLKGVNVDQNEIDLKNLGMKFADYYFILYMINNYRNVDINILNEYVKYTPITSAIEEICKKLNILPSERSGRMKYSTDLFQNYGKIKAGDINFFDFLDVEPSDFFSLILKLLEDCREILYKIDLIKTFYNLQKINFDSKFTFTKEEKTNRSSILTILLNNVYGPVKSYFEQYYSNSEEYNYLYNGQRSPGGTLDKDLWNIIKGNGVEERDKLIRLNGINDEPYINNAIINKARKLLNRGNSRCFTASLDPMGSFGDCAYRDNISDMEGNIEFNVYNHNQSNQFHIKLEVSPKSDISLEGRVMLKINNIVIINTTIKENNFNRKQPFSIANTISLLPPNLDTNPTNGIQTVFVRKFLGDFLQSVEAVNKKINYLGGDKPAAAMFYILSEIDTINPTKGGFVNPKGPDFLVTVLNGFDIIDKLLGRNLSPAVSPVTRDEVEAEEGGAEGGGKKKSRKKVKKTKRKSRKKVKKTNTKRKSRKKVKKTKTKRRKKTKTKRRRTNRRKKK